MLFRGLGADNPAAGCYRDIGTSTDRNMRPEPTQSTSGGPPNRETAEYYVLGDDHLGASVARGLQTAGHPVSLIDETHDPEEIPGSRGDPGDVRVLDDAGVSDDATVVVTTREDGRNLLIAQLVRAHFDVSDVLVLVNSPSRHDLVAAAGHEPVCATTVLSEALLERVVQRSREPGGSA